MVQGAAQGVWGKVWGKGFWAEFCQAGDDGFWGRMGRNPPHFAEGALVHKAQFAIAAAENADSGVFLQGLLGMEPQQLAAHPQVNPQPSPRCVGGVG